MKKVGISGRGCIVRAFALPVVLTASNTVTLNLCLLGYYFIIFGPSLKVATLRNVLPKSFISVSSHFSFHLLQNIYLTKIIIGLLDYYLPSTL